MGLLKMLGFGKKSKKIAEFIADGAIVIDVRSLAEYANGHIKGSKNIPLETILSNIETIKNYKKPVIACCASGMRSGLATTTLKSNGLIAMNGGSWSSLEEKL